MDFFGGSGTTGAAAIELNRRFVLMDHFVSTGGQDHVAR